MERIDRQLLNKMQYYICSLCCKLVQEPIQTVNGHRFCKECFFGRSGDHRCMLCIEDEVPDDQDCFKLDTELVYPDRGAMYDINKFPAWCKRCDCVSNYLDIMENHINNPCRDRGCCQLLYWLRNKLARIYKKFSNCGSPC